VKDILICFSNLETKQLITFKYFHKNLNNFDYEQI